MNWKKLIDRFKIAIGGRLHKFVIFDLKRSQKPLREELTSEILRYFTIRTTATIEEIEELYMVIGPNWMKLANATDLLDQGHKCSEVYKLACLGKI